MVNNYMQEEPTSPKRRAEWAGLPLWRVVVLSPLFALGYLLSFVLNAFMAVVAGIDWLSQHAAVVKSRMKHGIFRRPSARPSGISAPVPRRQQP